MDRIKRLSIYMPSQPYGLELIFGKNSITRSDFSVLYTREYRNKYILTPCFDVQEMSTDICFRYVFDNIYSGFTICRADFVGLKYVKDLGFYNSQCEIGFRCNKLNRANILEFDKEASYKLYNILKDFYEKERTDLYNQR